MSALEKQYFTMDMWLPEGTNIYETDRIAGEMADYVRNHKEVEMVSNYIGRTPPGIICPISLSDLSPTMRSY